MRILHIVAPAQYGGLERVVHALAAGQQQRGHDVTVGAVLEPTAVDQHPLVQRLRAAGVQVATLEVRHRRYLRERRLVADLCRSECPDVVHSHGARPDVLATPVVRALGIPIVATVHGFTGGGWKNRLYEYLSRRALRHVDAVVPVSRSQIPFLQGAGIARERIATIANAWRADGEPLDRAAARVTLGIPKSGWHVGWVGRLSHEKGADVLLDALARVPGSAWSASFLGDGAEEVRLVHQAQRLGIAHRVNWHGAVASADRLYRAFDAVVLSSRMEGVPIVLFEAMAAGVPVVATAVGGIPEVVSEREVRLVPSDDPEALAAALTELMADPGSAATRVAAAATALRTRLSAEAWLDQYDALYRRVARPQQPA